MNKIEEALNKLFEKHRVIFWYDEKEELVEQYQELNFPEVKKIHVQGNEFELNLLQGQNSAIFFINALNN